MKRGTESRVFLGKDTSIDEFTGINVLSTVLLGKKEGGFKDHNGLFIASNVTLGKGIARVITVVVYGTSPLSLPNAIEANIPSLKAFGGTEQETETIIQTATAQGKTKQSNLPSGYTQLEYIESSGTQYIDTGVTALETDEIIFTGTAKATGSQFFFSQGVSSNNQAFQVANTTPANGIVFDLQNYDPYRIITGVYAYDNVVTVRIANKEIFVNGTSYGTSTGTLTNPTDTMRLFISSAGAMYNIQMRRFTITGKIDLVPAKNSSGVIGMYDLVSGTFYTNAGTGDFVAGDPVVPTPTAPIPITCNNGVLKARHQSGLPLGYTLLDSITGDGLAGFSTGLTLQAGDIIDMEYEWLGAPSGQSSDRFFFGTSNADVSIGGCWVELYSSIGVVASWYVRFSSLSSVNTPSTNDQWKGHITLKRESFTVNNVEILTPSYNGDFQSTVLIFFGRLNQKGDAFNGSYLKVKSFTVKNNGAYRYYGIPCRNTNNELTFYDTVSGTDSTKVGTGDFTAGDPVSDPVEIYTDGVVETIKDSLNNTATAEMLLKVGDYEDVQSIIDGVVTRNVGVLVLDGTESWNLGSSSERPFYLNSSIDDSYALPNTPFCTHFQGIASTVTSLDMPDLTIRCGYEGFARSLYIKYKSLYSSGVAAFKQFLAEQYAAGTPVIIVYPLATPTTESVAGQNLRKEPLTVVGSLPNLLVNTTTGDAVPTPEYPLDIVCNNGVLKWDSVNQTVYADGTVETINAHGKNLFNAIADNIVVGYYIDNSGSYISSAPNFYTTEIEVKPNTIYTLSVNDTSPALRIAEYDSSHTFITRTAMASVDSMTTTTTANTKYVRLSCNIDSASVTVESVQNAHFQLELGSTATTYEPYFNGGSATAEMLLKVGDYQDVQSIIDGVVTRNVGVKVLNGTENWTWNPEVSRVYFYVNNCKAMNVRTLPTFCTHFSSWSSGGSASDVPNWYVYGSNDKNLYFKLDLSVFTSLATWKSYLADQYNAGTPVIVIYPLATATTESVTGQPMATTEGDNTAEITQASMDGLTLEVTYLAGATVTIQEVENAQLSDDVDVTIH